MTAFDLRSDEALAEIRRLRTAGALDPLREEMRAEFFGRRCLVVGSAPDVMLPADTAFDCIICVNGSSWILNRNGPPHPPEVTVVAGWSTRTNNQVRIETQRIWRGLETRLLLFVEAGATADEGRRVLDACGFRYDQFRSIDQLERAVIVGDVCGEELGWGKRDDRVSNGIFAAILAIWAGASEVILAGFSSAGGHAYMTEDTPRLHLQGDERFLSLADSLACPCSTTSADLARRFRLRLAPSREG